MVVFIVRSESEGLYAQFMPTKLNTLRHSVDKMA